MKKNILYHCVEAKKLSNILKEGLKAFIPFQRPTKPKGVYLSTQQFKWMWWATACGEVDGTIIGIDVNGLNLKQDFHNDERDKKLNSKGDFYVEENIEPSRIKSIFVQDKDNCFIDFNILKRTI